MQLASQRMEMVIGIIILCVLLKLGTNPKQCGSVSNLLSQNTYFQIQLNMQICEQKANHYS